MITYYVVQAFLVGNKGFLIPEEPREARSEGHARLWAERLAEGRAGVVAFSRTGDPATGDYDDAKIICQFGDVPELDLLLTG